MAEKGSIFLEDVTPDEVLDIIKELDNNKSSDIPIVVNKSRLTLTSEKRTCKPRARLKK